jgi:hypothetical protein
VSRLRAPCQRGPSLRSRPGRGRGRGRVDTPRVAPRRRRFGLRLLPTSGLLAEAGSFDKEPSRCDRSRAPRSSPPASPCSRRRSSVLAVGRGKRFARGRGGASRVDGPPCPARGAGATAATPSLPADCAEGPPPCYPPPGFVSQLCRGKYPGVAIVMFGKDQPWKPPS